MSIIKLENVFKQLGNRQVLNGLSLDLEEGETLAIVGPSGTGKSVTLNHIIGLMAPDRGKVEVLGKEINHLSGKALSEVRSKIGMLFQSGALLGWMNLYDNAALPLRQVFHLPEDEIRRKITEVFDLLKLSDSAEKFPDEISGGMKKRAGLARAVVCDPLIMLYDEPTSGLDPVMSRKIDELIVSLRDHMHISSIMVTHDLRSAFGAADRIAMLSEGRVIEISTPEEFRKSENPLVREFISAQFETA